MWLEQVEQDGFAILRGLLSDSEVDRAISLLDSHNISSEEISRGGVRDVLDHLPELQALSDHAAIRAAVHHVLGSRAFLVRPTLFDKTPGANWRVPWHQDLTIAVEEQRDVDDSYGPWSTKAGVTHVQPPTEVLDRMITLRLHLDPCGETNGALRVIPGTHKFGRVNQNKVSRYVVCFAFAAPSLTAQSPEPLPMAYKAAATTAFDNHPALPTCSTIAVQDGDPT
jgi:hypothetical protein